VSTSRIDHLRSLVAAIGARQTEYHQFFPSFADRLEQEFGDYVGSKESVALCCAYGDFGFDHCYRHSGLGFEGGRYRIPIMIRLKNLKDDGDFLIRVRLYFTKMGAALSVQIDGECEITLDEGDISPLNDYIYKFFCKCLAETKWFEQNKSDYQGTGIGFTTAS